MVVKLVLVSRPHGCRAGGATRTRSLPRDRRRHRRRRRLRGRVLPADDTEPRRQPGSAAGPLHHRAGRRSSRPRRGPRRGPVAPRRQALPSGGRDRRDGARRGHARLLVPGAGVAGHRGRGRRRPLRARGAARPGGGRGVEAADRRGLGARPAERVGRRRSGRARARSGSGARRAREAAGGARRASQAVEPGPCHGAGAAGRRPRVVFLPARRASRLLGTAAPGGPLHPRVELHAAAAAGQRGGLLRLSAIGDVPPELERAAASAE
jgi:hypothetical protein